MVIIRFKLVNSMDRTGQDMTCRLVRHKVSVADHLNSADQLLQQSISAGSLWRVTCNPRVILSHFSLSLHFLAMNDRADSGASGYSDGDDISLLEAAIEMMASKVVEHLGGQARSYRRVLHDQLVPLSTRECDHKSLCMGA